MIDFKGFFSSLFFSTTTLSLENRSLFVYFFPSFFLCTCKNPNNIDIFEEFEDEDDGSGLTGKQVRKEQENKNALKF